MGKYSVNYSCGHQEGVELFGKVSDREKRVEWMERGICPECFRKQKEEEKRIANEQAAKDNAESGLVKLVGSEKQILWAESIRKNALSSRYNTVIVGYVPKDENDKLFYEKALELRKKLEQEASAKWWIDNRNNNLSTYIRDCLNSAKSVGGC